MRWIFSAAPFDGLVSAKEGVRFHNDPRCEHCGYSLNMLASLGKCPECGQPYDERSRFRKLRRPLCGRGVILLPLVISECAFVLALVSQSAPAMRGNVTALCYLVSMLAIFVGNGLAAGWFLRWIVVLARVREGRTHPIRQSFGMQMIGIGLGVMLYLLMFAASVAVVVWTSLAFNRLIGR